MKEKKPRLILAPVIIRKRATKSALQIYRRMIEPEQQKLFDAERYWGDTQLKETAKYYAQFENVLQLFREKYARKLAPAKKRHETATRHIANIAARTFNAYLRKRGYRAPLPEMVKYIKDWK